MQAQATRTIGGGARARGWGAAPRIVCVASIALFVLLCLAFLPYPGLQYDEMLFAQPLYERAAAVFGRTVPLMSMSYLGSLKTWLYAGLFGWWRPSPYSVRVPVIILAALTIVLVYRFVARVHSRTAAAIACALLATDSAFILTSTFDWGPVVLQHLLYVAGLAALASFFQTHKCVFLCAGFFCFGLALWDKALFIWVLSGTLIAGAVVLRRGLLPYFSVRNVAAALGSLAVGALPLIWYNVAKHGETLRANANLNWTELWPKFVYLLSAMSGHELFGYLTYNEPPQRAPAGLLESASAFAAHALGAWKYDLLALLLAASLPLAVVVLRGASARLYALCGIAATIAWLEMALTHDAGVSLHHIVLLWPLPQIMIGTVAAALIKHRATLIVLAAALMVNILNVNQYFFEMSSAGSPQSWTDAVTTAADTLTKQRRAEVLTYEWGLANTFRAVSRGLVHQRELPDLLDGGPAALAALPGARSDMWAAWAPEFSISQGAGEKFEALATAAGLHKTTLQCISDRYGRRAIELFTLSPGALPQRTNIGVLDDTSAQIVFTGDWTRGGRFGAAAHGTLTYSDQKGATARFRFAGDRVTYVFTRAFNRGMAAIDIDGRRWGTLDLYAPRPEWQQRQTFSGLGNGDHQIAVSVLGAHDARATGSFIDIDGFIIPVR